ncbi:MAG: enoyl-CoA hydratase [Pseudomonadota bacterium]
MSEELGIAMEGDVAWVTLNRPAQRNALTFEMYDGVAAFCRAAPIDGTVKAIVIKGAGDKAFAAGTDMAQFRGFESDADALAYERRIDGVLSDIERCPIPTIAAITGACTGGGAAIAAACDLRICDQRLKFGFPIARTLGNCLSLASLDRLSTLLGAGRLREILFTARLIEAEEALAIGLVAEAPPDAPSVRARAAELAETLAAHAPLTLRATKEGLRRLRVHGAAATGDDLVLSTYLSADFKEGLEAFLAKRKPEWRGR